MNLSPGNRVIPDPNFPSRELRMTEELCIITQTLQENQDPHSSKPLTLEEEENPDTQILPNPDTENPPPPLDQPVEEQMQDDLEEGANFSPLATYSRRGGTGGGPRRKKINQKRRAAHEKKLQKKLEILVENINPIPFVPIKTLDFSSHEELLRRLGLWDFVHLEFDRSIRSDLIVQLIANYSASSRSSYVNGVRIMVNRADLARALRLPVRKEKAGTVSENAPVFDETEESVTFIEGLVSNWMLLHEDMWMMPDEMMNWTKLIKEGHFEKVDWATLMWFMLEKELLAAPKLGDCYYASHMQCLIKCQREALLREEEPKMEIDTKEDEDCSVDLKVVDDTRGPEIEERDIELSLGQDNTLKEEAASKEHVGIDGVMDEKEDDVNEEPMDIEETKGEECGQWVVDGKSNVGTRGLFLRRCNLGDLGNVGGMSEESKGGEEEEEEDGHGEEEREGQEGNEEVLDMGFHLSPKGDALETVTSANLIATMEAMQSEPFSSGLQLHDDNGPSGEFLVSKVSTHLVPGSSMLFGNGSNKRVIEQENDMSHQSLNDSNKRLRTEGPWDTDPDDFYTCMDQIQELTGKAKMMYLAKERDSDGMSVNQQYLVSEMQERDNLIEYLRKAQHEEQQKRRVEVYRLERELYTMGNLLEGYRKALKETHKAFSEYRARCPMPEEPLYKDAGSGGLVLTKWELEKLRMEQEEEERMNQLLIQNIKDFEAGWIAKFGLHEQEIGFLGNRLQEVEKKRVHVKEAFTKRKLSERMESDANEGRTVSEMVESGANEGGSVSEMVESGANEAGSDE